MMLRVMLSINQVLFLSKIKKDLSIKYYIMMFRINSSVLSIKIINLFKEQNLKVEKHILKLTILEKF